MIEQSKKHHTDPLNVDVSVIYVNWNCADEIEQSIVSVREMTVDCTYEIVVVDNDSAQGVGSLADDQDIRLLVNGRNGGFGAGCNLGAAAAKGKYLLFLNPDTRLLNDAVSELMRFLDAHPQVGIAGARVEDSDGAVMFEGARSLPSLKNEFLQHSTLSFRFPQYRWFADPYLSDWDHLSTREVGSVIGACMMVSRWGFHDIGGFDEKFFLYCEEVDLCRRMKDKGHGIWYVHTGRILHKERQSTMKLYGTLSGIILQNLKSQDYYFRKHNGLLHACTWRSMLVVVYVARYILHRDRAHFGFIRWAVTA